MNAEEWEKVKEIFDEALKLAPRERRPFLDKACNGDNELRSEVESLLSSFGNANSFMNEPAAAEIANLVVKKNDKLVAGQRLSHYKILSQIGVGGMGKVYLAHDDTLQRKVAIKILSTDFTSDRDRLKRFKREAHAASSLNHPNILTIHEIGSENGQHFIVTEFIEGETLRQYKKLALSDLPKILDIGLQVASALSAAHQAGIVHRDIKPENIMLRRDGFVKVVDFGLVKLIENKAQQLTTVDTDVSTQEMYTTIPGTVMGTVNYMSPEQARGLHIDARTDIWSLGIVLYELISNNIPFTGKTSTDVLAAILNNDPPPLSRYAPDTPAELQQIIQKTLCKDCEGRYQQADNLIADLRKIKNKLDGAEHKSTEILRPTVATSPVKASSISSKFVSKPIKPFLLILALSVIALFFYFIRPPTSTTAPKPEALKLFNNGTEAVRDGTYFKASKMLEDAVKSDPNFVLAHARLAESWMELDYVGRAQNELLKVRTLQQDKQKEFSLTFSAADDESLYTEAINATVLRDFPKAVGVYQTITNRYPNEPYAYLDLGRAYEKNDEIDKAIENYEKAAALNPQSGAAFLRLGMLRSRKFEFEKANKLFDTAETNYDRVSNDEGIAEAKIQRGVFLNLQDKLEPAKSQFEQVLQMPRANKYQQIRAMLQISSVCYSGAKVTCAQDYASKAISLAKEERMDNLATNGLIDLGYPYLVSGDYEKAEQLFQQALDSARKDAQPLNQARALLSLGSLRIEQIKPDEAESFINQALPFYQKGDYNQQFTQAKLLLGRAYQMKESYDAALQAFEQAENSENASTRAYAKMASANILMNQEKYPEALRRFEQSYDLYQSMGNLQYIIYILLYQSEVLCRLGHFENSRNKFLKAEVMIKEGDSSLTPLLSNIQLLNAQIALSEQNFPQAISDAAQARAGADSVMASDINRIIGLAQTISNPKNLEGVQKCVKALQFASDTKDLRTINTAKLALAEAYLNTGHNSDALTIALQAKDYFITAEQKESAWRAWLIAARASKQKGDLINAREYASKALDTLSKLQVDWGEEYSKIYLAKPDIILYRTQAEELAKS